MARKYPHNSPYAFSENRVIDGLELEGLEFENFMSGYLDPGELALKLPDLSKAQEQIYTLEVANPEITFEQFKDKFKETPQDYLTSSTGTFNTPTDGEGNTSTFSVENFIKIDVDGPLNNSVVKILKIEEDDKSFSATFGTLFGHVEKGIINFSIKEMDNGEIQFRIHSFSENDQLILTGESPTLEAFTGNGSIEDLSRSLQASSWIEVLGNVSDALGGTVQKKEFLVNPVTNDFRKTLDKYYEVQEDGGGNEEFEWEETPK